MHYTCTSTAWLAPKKQQRIDHTCWQFPYSIGWWRNLLWACPPHRPRRPLWLSSASASVHQWGHIADRLALPCDTALWKSRLYHTHVGILCKSFCPHRSRDYLPAASGKVFWHDVCENIETHSSLYIYIYIYVCMYVRCFVKMYGSNYTDVIYYEQILEIVYYVSLGIYVPI